MGNLQESKRNKIAIEITPRNEFPLNTRKNKLLRKFGDISCDNVLFCI